MQQNYLQDSLFKNIIKNGTFYNPAAKHYSQLFVNVVCDKCKKSNLDMSIGWENYDLCLSCANNIKKDAPFTVPDIMTKMMDPIGEVMTMMMGPIAEHQMPMTRMIEPIAEHQMPMTRMMGPIAEHQMPMTRMMEPFANMTKQTLDANVYQVVKD